MANAQVVKELTDEELAERCGVLLGSISSVVFNYIRRGLFDKDKLMVATLLTLRIQVAAGEVSPLEMNALVKGLIVDETENMGNLDEWMTQQQWEKISALEKLDMMEGFLDNFVQESDDWQKWYNAERPEIEKMPGGFDELSEYHKLLVIKSLRPDRLTIAVTTWITNVMGDEYVNQAPFDMTKTYQESNASTPIFFVLFPGVDPTPLVEGLGKKLGITADKGKFVNISMGQGQEERGKNEVKRLSREGGWIMLQNVHLMPGWLPTLERQLELCSTTAHADFRCFVSAEPPAMSFQKIIPESLMQSCIKVSNENPTDLKSNLKRAWANFSQDVINRCVKKTEFKACLFTLCFFHSLIQGRRKYGQIGWSKTYPFNTGDLKICADVMESYLNNKAVVPWDDMRYLFVEIMYGGHVTDEWDRRTNATYLRTLLHEGVFKGQDLIPCNEGLVKFHESTGAGEDEDEYMDEDEDSNKPKRLYVSLDPKTSEYADYTAYIEDKLPREQPLLFGLHANAEIGFLSNSASALFDTIISLGGGSGGGGAGDAASEAKQMLDMIVSKVSLEQ